MNASVMTPLARCVAVARSVRADTLSPAGVCARAVPAPAGGSPKYGFTAPVSADTAATRNYDLYMTLPHQGPLAHVYYMVDKKDPAGSLGRWQIARGLELQLAFGAIGQDAIDMFDGRRFEIEQFDRGIQFDAWKIRQIADSEPIDRADAQSGRRGSGERRALGLTASIE